MSIELVQVNSAWCLLDKSVPGWRTVESHGEKARAEMRLEILSRASSVASAGEKAGAPKTTEPPEDTTLTDFLDGSVRDVRARIVECMDVEMLQALGEAEGEQAGRKTVLKALAARISALS